MKFLIPDEVKRHIQQYLQQGANDESVARAQYLSNAKEISYYELKRILHDMKYLDRKTQLLKYNLWGGEPMERWGWKQLNQERLRVDRRKQEQSAANKSGAIGRKNPYNKEHTRADDKTSDGETLNFVKNSPVKSIMPAKLFEEINKMKKLM